MTEHIFNFPAPFAKSSKKTVIPVYFISASDFPKWIKKQNKSLIAQAYQANFIGQAKQALSIVDAKAAPIKILAGIKDPAYYLDSASVVQHIQNSYGKDFINDHVFEIISDHEEDILNKICLGWGMAAYKFDVYKKNDKAFPTLLWPAKALPKEVTAKLEAVSLLRNLVNTPAADLGTDELADVAKDLAKKHKAKVKIFDDGDLKKKNFPMIYAVGKASPRRPQLVDLKWKSNTKKSKPAKVTIVGKGVVYDTGGLNLKPGQYMRDMKKDMGGAAHALAVAHMIMALNLPIELRVLLPIAENAVAGNSYRPGDILNSRKGITVEICDTDAEGRLIVADALTYACEEKPDLLVDFCTLTGAARVAVGYDIPAFFSNDDDILDDLRHSSVIVDDPVWPFPLWDGYDSNLNGSISDIKNEGTGRAGHIEAALFLQRFIDKKTDWIHLDCYAWQNSDIPGRPQGGADTGARAIFDFIRKRYG